MLSLKGLAAWTYFNRPWWGRRDKKPQSLGGLMERMVSRAFLKPGAGDYELTILSLMEWMVVSRAFLKPLQTLFCF